MVNLYMHSACTGIEGRMKEFSQDLNYNDVIACKKAARCEHTLTVISNITLKPVFHKFIYYYRDKLEVQYIDTNSYLALEAQYDYSFVVLSLRDLAPHLYYHFYELSIEEVSKEVERLEDYLEFLFRKLKCECRLVILSCFENEYLASTPIGQVSFQSIIYRLNELIRNLIRDIDQIHILDINRMIMAIGYKSFYNKLNYYHTNSPFSALACNMLSYFVLSLIEQITNQSKKCLVLDCDNVLWGGSAGEDGMEGLLLSNQFMGRAYLDLQREIIKLYYQGIIICLCSKNKLSDIKDILSKHPDMLLKENFISAMKINYNNKADNIRELSKELNISLDAMVFADDNPYEISLINYELPEVTTIQLNPQRPYQYSEIFRNLACFYKKKLNENDQMRGKQYKEQEARLHNRSLYTNIEAYHASLQTEITISKVDEYSISRVAELSQRTNQFNLSGKHYTLEELQALLAKDYEILYLRAKDKFGDMGIIASGVVKLYKDFAVIEAMFLSCRVFGRGFELSLITEIEKVVLKRNINNLYGVYNENKKNEMFKNFYKENNIPLYIPNHPNQ